MIKTKIYKKSKKPVAVLMDYKEFKRLKMIEMDRLDYTDAIEIKKSNKTWKSHNDLKSEILAL